MKLPKALKQPFFAVAASVSVTGVVAGGFAAWNVYSQPRTAAPAAPVKFTGETEAPETPPNYRIAHVESFSDDFNTPLAEQRNKFYSRHAETAAQILTDSYTGEVSARSEDVGYVNRNFCDMNKMRMFYEHIDVMSVSMVSRCPSEESTQSLVDFWQNRSPTILFKAAGNAGRNRITAYSNLWVNPTDYMDTRIYVGEAAEDKKTYFHSSIEADIMAVNPFDQGFAFPYYPTAEETQEAITYYKLPAFNSERVSPEAGSLKENGTGTSFSAPRAAGDYGALILEKRAAGYSSYTIWAAILASANPVELKPQCDLPVTNARGFPYDSRCHGFGFMDSHLTRTALNRYNYIDATPDVEMHQIMAGSEVGNRATFEVTQDMITGSVLGEITVTRPPSDTFDYFFMRGVEITSPSGTKYVMGLHNSFRRSPDGQMKLFFRTPGFLGEDAVGTWTVEVNHSAKILDSEMVVYGSNRGGMTDRMLGFVRNWRNNHDEDARRDAIYSRRAIWSGVTYSEQTPQTDRPLYREVTP